MELPSREPWSPERAEELLSSLETVESVRLVLGRSGRLDEIHVLATDELSAKQIVRNVETALLTHFRRSVDHRKISVAQIQLSREAGKPAAAPQPTTAPLQNATPAPDLVPLPNRARTIGTERMLLVSHRVVSQPWQGLTATVVLEWRGKRFEGAAHGADVAHARLETVSRAALKAVEAAARSDLDSRGKERVWLDFEGVAVVDDGQLPVALVSVNAVSNGTAKTLTGAVGVGDDESRAAVFATLQATDRWVRGHLEH